VNKIFRWVCLCFVWTPLNAQSSSGLTANLNSDPRVSDAMYLLDQWIGAQRDYLGIPGISFAVVHDQEVLWSTGYGYADLESKEPATPDTVYSICSISKLFTSIATMRLRDQGKFRLDTPVESLLPWFKPENPYPEGPPITVEGLLSHSSGLPDRVGHSEMPPFDLPGRDEIIDRIPELKLLFPAWQHENYTNLSMVLAGEIIEQVTGLQYAEYIKQHILLPLDMTSTVVEIGDLQGTRKLATGYSAPRRDGNRRKLAPFAGRGLVAAYGFASTVHDLAKFASWQFRLFGESRIEILHPNTLQEMHRIHFLEPGWTVGWGLGFTVIQEDGKLFVGHAGFCPGFQSTLHMQPDDKIATIGVTNTMLPIWKYTDYAYKIVAPAVRAALESPGTGKSLFSRFRKYVGGYDSFPFGGEFHIIPWEGSLAVVRFPNDAPLSAMRRLRHIEGNRFRLIMEGGWLGADYVFELDPKGQVIQLLVDDNPLPRIVR